MVADLASIPPVEIIASAHNREDLAMGEKMFYFYMFPVKIDNLYMLESRLNSFKLLSHNWDGYGATTVDNLAIVNSLKFLQALPEHLIETVNSDDITPTPYGTIVIEWGNIKGELISTEVGNQSFGFYTEFKDSYSPKIDQVPFNENSLPVALFSAFKKLYKD